MAGATITATKISPQQGGSIIYFSGTTDASKDLDFSAYTSVDWIKAVVAADLTPEDVAAYTAGGDIRFTSALTAIKGMAKVNF